MSIQQEHFGNFREICDAIAACTTAEKKVVLRQLVYELQNELGEGPFSISVPNEDEKVVGYVVPVQWYQMKQNSARISELEQQMKSPGETATLSEVMERLRSRES